MAAGQVENAGHGAVQVMVGVTHQVAANAQALVTVTQELLAPVDVPHTSAEWL